jgi:hypothetical protein
MTRGLWLADFQQEFPISELRCSCSSGAGRTTLSTEVAASVALHCRKLGRDRTNALIAVGRPLSPRMHNHASLQTTADCLVPGGASRDDSLASRDDSLE